MANRSLCRPNGLPVSDETFKTSVKLGGNSIINGNIKKDIGADHTELAYLRF